MNFLEERIKKDGRVINSNILKVDSFINHQIDPLLMEKVGNELANYFQSKNISRVITVESSGIAPALMTAIKLGVDLVVMKKRTSSILSEDLYQTKVMSFTKGEEYTLTMSKKYIKEGENILIIDDFLANGEAASGMIRIIEEAHANVVGIGILIEKSFQPGRKKLEDKGIDVYSLVRVKSLSKGKVELLEE